MTPGDAGPEAGRKNQIPPARPWRATCIQTPCDLVCDAPTPEAAHRLIEQNLDRAIALIDAAMASAIPPDLVVLPEFAFQGPPHGLPASRWIALACPTIPGQITDRLGVVARRHGLYIGGHQFDSDPDWPGRYFNTCFLIAPDGSVALRYRRINTAAFPSPHDLWTHYTARHSPQEIFPVVDTPLGRIGMVPCGEINVPEVTRMLMMQGAEIILHTTNSPPRPTQEAAKIARAAENMVYLISANIAGPIGFSRDGSIQGGRSHILNFLGETLAWQENPAPDISVSALIDIDALRTARATARGTANQLILGRWEAYAPFYNAAHFYPADSFLETPMETSADLHQPQEAARHHLEAAGLRLNRQPRS